MSVRAIALPKTKTNRIGSQSETISIDSCLDETHTLSNQVTDHPLEEGINTTDHCRPEPDIVQLRCFISNVPLGNTLIRAINEGTATEEGQTVSRADTAFKQLKKLRDTGAILTVVTTLKTYGATRTDGMMIQSLSIPRTRQNYDGLEFTIGLKQVRIVTNKTTPLLLATDKRTQPKKKKGKQTPQDKEDRRTFLKQGADVVRGR